MFDVSLTGVLLYDPPEGHPGQLAYTFAIHILSTSRTQRWAAILKNVSIKVIQIHNF
jgi:hypothetical protein